MLYTASLGGYHRIPGKDSLGIWAPMTPIPLAVPRDPWVRLMDANKPQGPQSMGDEANSIGRFPGGGLGNQNPARTTAHLPPGVKETLNYLLKQKNTWPAYSESALGMKLIDRQTTHSEPEISSTAKKLNRLRVACTEPTANYCVTVMYRSSRI